MQGAGDLFDIVCTCGGCGRACTVPDLGDVVLREIKVAAGRTKRVIVRQACSCGKRRSRERIVRLAYPGEESPPPSHLEEAGRGR